MVGDEKQTRELVDTLSNAGTEELWQSNIFGKSVYDLIRDSALLPLPIRAPKASAKDRLEEPMNSPPTPQTTTAASMASRTRVFLRFRFCN